MHNMHVHFVTPTARISKIYFHNPYRKQSFCIKSLLHNCQIVTRRGFWANTTDYNIEKILLLSTVFSYLYDNRSLLIFFWLDLCVKNVIKLGLLNENFWIHIMSPLCACCVQIHGERKITKGEDFSKYEVQDFSTYEIGHKPFFLSVLLKPTQSYMQIT